MPIPTTAIGSPYRMLDTRQRQSRSNNTYKVLSDLADSVGSAIGVAKQDHNADMERQARNDLVNETINNDLEVHEEAYAKIVIRGQSEQAFMNMKDRIAEGEFDHQDPEDFQEEVNDLHTHATSQYRDADYYASMQDEYNKFWVKNEVSLTAAQASRYRLKLHTDQGNALVGDIINGLETPGMTPDTLKGIIYNPEYTMLSPEDIMSTTFTAAVSASANGHPEILEEFDNEFNYSSHPGYMVKYSAAYKAAIKTSQDISKQEAMQLRVTYDSIVEKGGLSIGLWDKFGTATQGGTPVVSYKQFSADLVKSGINNIEAKAYTQHEDNAQKGIDISNTTKEEDFQSINNDIIKKIVSQEGVSPSDKGIMIGKHIATQTKNIKQVMSMGTTFAGHTVMLKDGTVNPLVSEGFAVLEGIRAGMNNDAKFYSSIGKAKDSFIIMKHEQDAIVGTAKEKSEGAAKQLDAVRAKVESGTNRKVARVPRDYQEKLQEVASEVFTKEDSWYLWDSHREETVGTTDYNNALLSEFKYAVNYRGLSDEQALEWATETVADQFVNFDDNLSASYGAAYEFGDTYEHIAETLNGDPSINAMLASTQGLKEADKETSRMKLSFEDESIVWVDNTNSVLMKMPMEHAKVLNEGLRMGVEDEADFTYAYSEAVLDTREGKRQAMEHKIQNDKFFTEVVSDPDRTVISPHIPVSTPAEYFAMSEQEKTENRVEYYRKNIGEIQGLSAAWNQIRRGAFPTGLKVLADAGYQAFAKVIQSIKDHPTTPEMIEIKRKERLVQRGEMDTGLDSLGGEQSFKRNDAIKTLLDNVGSATTDYLDDFHRENRRPQPRTGRPDPAKGVINTGLDKLSQGNTKGTTNPKDSGISKFQSTVMEQENSIKKGRSKDGVWTPHESAEGGTDTIGYGHKLTKAEVKSGKIKVGLTYYKFSGKDSEFTDKVITKLFKQDWAKAKKTVSRTWVGFKALSNTYKDLLTELEFNTAKVVSKHNWPKLFKAMLAKDNKEVSKEIMRSYKNSKGNRVPLTARVNALRKAANLK